MTIQHPVSLCLPDLGPPWERPLCPDCVEKLDLSGAPSADSLPLKQGRSGDDGAEAGSAGRAVLRVLD